MVIVLFCFVTSGKKKIQVIEKNPQLLRKSATSNCDSVCYQAFWDCPLFALMIVFYTIKIKRSHISTFVKVCCIILNFFFDSCLFLRGSGRNRKNFKLY